MSKMSFFLFWPKVQRDSEDSEFSDFLSIINRVVLVSVFFAQNQKMRKSNKNCQKSQKDKIPTRLHQKSGKTVI